MINNSLNLKKKTFNSPEILSNKSVIFLRPQHKKFEISELMLNKRKLLINLGLGKVIKNRNLVNPVLGST